ncbi:MAG: metallophosphoesterase [bacterium]|nr:metallophosphoesterase [bacterium]
MIVLGIGDVIGRPGRDALRAVLPAVRAKHAVDLVVVNAENSAGGLGTTPETADDLFAVGADVLTGGNHTWKHREYAAYLDANPRALRPFNYPEAPGRGIGVFATRDGRAFAVVNLIGRTFMEPTENPFRAVERALAEIGDKARVVIVDMHCEASSEKRAMGWHLDGRVSVVWGTHTHVPTADEEILPGGTAYLGDIGMTGPYASVIGLDPVHAVKKFVTSRPTSYKVAEGNVQVRAVLVDVDETTGKARSIERLTLRP